MDAILNVVGAAIFLYMAYMVFKLCVGTPGEEVNPELARKIDNAMGMTDEGFRKTQAFCDARMLDPDVEYCTVMSPAEFKGFLLASRRCSDLKP